MMEIVTSEAPRPYAKIDGRQNGSVMFIQPSGDADVWITVHGGSGMSGAVTVTRDDLREALAWIDEQRAG